MMSEMGVPATVWTRSGGHARGPKCIFSGRVKSIPREGEWVIVRESFCEEIVRCVTHDLVSGEIEITVDTLDVENAYGPCLLHGEG